MRIKFKLFCFLIAIGGLGASFSFSHAQLNIDSVSTSGQIRAITTAVPFLLINPDSRHGGLADAGVAITDNSNASHHNLSALAFAESKGGISLSYTPWLRALVPDINLGYLSGFYNLGEKNGAVSGSLRFFSLGEIKFTNEIGEEIGRSNASEFAIDGGYTRKVTDNFSAGIGLRFIYSNLAATGAGSGSDAKPGLSFAGDISMMYSKDFEVGNSGMPLTFNWGLNLSNIGAKMAYTSSSDDRDFIPSNFKTGIMLRGYFDEYNSLAVTVDVNKLMVPSEGGQSDKALMEGIFSSWGDAQDGVGEEFKEVNLSLGIEYWYNKLFAIRTGLFLEDKTKGNRKFVTLGAGLKYKVFTIDFAYLASLKQAHPLQNTLRFTLSFDFQPEGQQ